MNAADKSDLQRLRRRSPTSRRPDSLTRERGRRATPERRMAHSDFLVSSHGARSPRILYGTAWKKMRTQELVRVAIERGFRGIDTACQPKHYQEAGVGAGVAACLNDKLRRSDLYLQTKFTPLSGQDPAHVPYDPGAPLAQQVAQSFSTSLLNLQSDYVDLPDPALRASRSAPDDAGVGRDGADLSRRWRAPARHRPLLQRRDIADAAAGGRREASGAAESFPRRHRLRSAQIREFCRRAQRSSTRVSGPLRPIHSCWHTAR